MPLPENTPASSRRFLPTASSSAARITATPATQRNPFGVPRWTQLPPSSSSFHTTPRFQPSTPREADEIQTSFEDEEAALPKNQPVTRAGSDILQEDDYDDDEDLYSLHDRHVEAKDSGYGHIEGQSSPLQHRQKPFSQPNKRRKVTHNQINAGEAIGLSSPLGDNEQGEFEGQLDHNVSISHSDLDDDLVSPSRLITKDEANRQARFRPLTADSLQDSPGPRMTFRPNIEDSSTGKPLGGVVLPEIFTPSRRKGKRDYIAGGSADLVRSWVLAIPAQESENEKLNEESITVAAISHDSSGRFAIASDEDGIRWLLPEQQVKVDTALGTSLSLLRPGTRILIRGRATRWELNLSSSSTEATTVAAYWSVLPP